MGALGFSSMTQRPDARATPAMTSLAKDGVLIEGRELRKAGVQGG